MQKLKRTIPILAAVALTFGTMVSAQQQAPAQQPPAQQPPAQQAPQPQTAQGELVRVDSDAKVLVVRTSAAQMQFKYTADTKVSGAEEGIAGLGTMTGSQVTVQYNRQGEDNIATQIAVQPKPR